MKKSMLDYYSDSELVHMPWRNPATDSLVLTYIKNKSESYDVRFVRMDGEALSEPDRQRAREIIDTVNTVKKRWLSDHWFWRFSIHYKREEEKDSTDEVFLTCVGATTTLLTMYVYIGDKYGLRLSNIAEMLLYQFSGQQKNDRGVLAAFFQFWFDPSKRTSLTLVLDHQV